MQGTKYSAVPPIFLSGNDRLSICVTCSHVLTYSQTKHAFRQTAPVGNFKLHLHLKELTAGDSLSLEENALY